MYMVYSYSTVPEANPNFLSQLGKLGRTKQITKMNKWRTVSIKVQKLLEHVREEFIHCIVISALYSSGTGKFKQIPIL